MMNNKYAVVVNDHIVYNSTSSINFFFVALHIHWMLKQQKKNIWKKNGIYWSIKFGPSRETWVTWCLTIECLLKKLEVEQNKHPSLHWALKEVVKHVNVKFCKFKTQKRVSIHYWHCTIFAMMILDAPLGLHEFANGIKITSHRKYENMVLACQRHHDKYLQMKLCDFSFNGEEKHVS